MVELVGVPWKSPHHDGPRFPICDARNELEPRDIGQLSVHGDLAIEDYPSGVIL